MPRSLTTHVRPGVGGRLKGSRLRAGLSQRQLAFPGCTAAYISRLEADARTPSLQMLVELAHRLDVDPHWLATGDSSTGVIADALDAGRRFVGSFNRAVTHDGTVVLGLMAEVADAASRFDQRLAAIPPDSLDEVYALDELRRVRVELGDCRRRLATIEEAIR